MISTRSPEYRALAAGKYATTVLFVNFLYSWYPTNARMSASTTASAPKITDARGRLTEMLLNSGYLPSRRCRRLHPCCRCRAPAGYCRVPAGPAVRVAMLLAGVPRRDSPEPDPVAVPAARCAPPAVPARSAPGRRAIGIPGVGGNPLGFGGDEATSGNAGYGPLGPKGPCC